MMRGNNLMEDKNIVNSDLIDELTSKLKAEDNTENQNNNDNKIVMEDYFETTKNDYLQFDERAWNKGDGYKIPNYPIITEKLEGLESGLYLFAAESNAGKSAIMMNIMKDICSYKDNKLFGIYYSLDDSKNEIIPRVIAMEQKIPISVASKPQRYVNLIEQGMDDSIQLYQDQLDKRERGLNKLISESNLFKIEDTDKIKNHEDLLNHVKNVQTYVKSIDPEMNVIIAIDSINDIKLNYNTTSDNKKSEDIAVFVKDLAVDLDIVVFASCHLRKLNGNRRPTIDDLRDANTLIYESSVIWLLYNDVSKNKDGAKIYWLDKEVESNKGAVIEIDWAKNKKSSYKGRTFCKFKPYYSLTVECSNDENKRFDQTIYQS
jgi:replicative DNA helicase